MFQGYRCWEPADLQAVAQIEAGSFEHLGAEGADAVFLATHQPTKLRKSEALVDETDLLRDFSRPVTSEQHLFFITGKRGTGKSHIVKWLQARIGNHPDWHEVYIEKRNTSLQRVLETILQGLSGPAIDDMRERLRQNARSLKSVDEAKEKLLFELAFLVGRPDPGAASSGPHKQALNPEYVEHLQEHLPALLLDGVTRRVLLREEGPLERITRLAFEGTGQGDINEADLRLSAEQLPLQPENLADAGREVRDLIRQMGMYREMRDIAVAMLNRHLATAKAQVFMGKGVDLVAVFEEVRRYLAGRGLELCLFIEDLVLLHGIDQELAHVLTIGRGADASLCAIRAAIAVTEGYLDDIETLKSRGVRYSLDLHLGTRDLPTTSARSFVARYLNAARLGPERLVQARRDAHGEDWVPNGCAGCPHVVPCHTAFGKSAEGHGFYPFNDKAVDRVVELASREIYPHFDPRDVIRGGMRDPLEVAWDELPAGAFPSERFAAPLDAERENVAPEVKVAIGKREDDTTAARRVSVLAFWNKGADTLANVDAGIHSAFNLPELTNVEQDEDEGGDKGPEIEKGTDPETTRRVAAFKAIDSWSVGKQTLNSDLAGTVRQAVLGAVVFRLQYGPSGLKVTGSGRSRWRIGRVDVDLRTVSIDDSQGGAADVELPFRVSFERSAENAVLFKNIWRTSRGSSWAFDANGTAYASFMDRVTKEADRLREFVTRSAGVDLDPALQLLAVSARLREPLPDDVADIPAALFGPPGVAMERSSSWARLRQASDAGRRIGLTVLRDELSGAKGRGAPSVLDVAPILGSLDRLSKVKQVTERRGTEELLERLKSVMKTQQEAAESEWKSLGRQLSALAPLIRDGDRWDELQKAVTAAVEEAHSLQVLPLAETRDDLAALRDAVDPRALEQFRRLCKEQPAPEGAVKAESLWTLVPDPAPALDRLHAYLQRSREILEYVERRIADRQARQSGEGPTPSKVVDQLRGLADEFDALAKEG